jgi:ferrous iron transport protein B
MMTFPVLPDSQTELFEQQRQAVKLLVPAEVVEEDQAAEADIVISAGAQALKESLLAVDAKEAEAALKYSLAGRIGSELESVSRFAGFDWRTNIALVGGFAAKEVVVSTLGTAYSLGDVNPEESGSLAEKLAGSPNWRPLVALSLIIFTIFYSPCFVSIVCIMKEAGSWKWGVFSVLFNTLLAFTLAMLIYQIGTAMGF